MLMCITYTTSQDEKEILKILSGYESIIQVLRCLYMKLTRLSVCVYISQ